MSQGNNTRQGIWLMVATCVVFSAQDGISRHLAEEYNILMVVMIRYWFFAAFVMTVSARRKPVDCATPPRPASRSCKPFADCFWRWRSA